MLHKNLFRFFWLQLNKKISKNWKQLRKEEEAHRSLVIRFDFLVGVLVPERIDEENKVVRRVAEGGLWGQRKEGALGLELCRNIRSNLSKKVSKERARCEEGR